jgi:hypothetical protein
MAECPTNSGLAANHHSHTCMKFTGMPLLCSYLYLPTSTLVLNHMSLLVTHPIPKLTISGTLFHHTYSLLFMSLSLNILTVNPPLSLHPGTILGTNSTTSPPPGIPTDLIWL